MARERRGLPPNLLDADKKVERWREDILRKPALTAYQLIKAVGLRVADLVTEYIPGDLSRYEMATRAHLLGLQFALAGLPADRPDGPFDQAQQICLSLRRFSRRL